MNRKILSIVLISIFLLSVIPSVWADEDRSYTIDSADFILTIEETGILKVNESITYIFHGQYNGVYRDIPLKKGQTIDDLNVSAEGAYTKTETYTTDDGDYRIKVYLYSDSALSKPIKDTSVVIHYNYNFDNVINIYNDIGELHYKLWDDNWDVPAQKLSAQIQFPQDKQIKYWINPYDAETHQSWSGNILTIESDGKVDSYLEFRGLIPLSEFKNPNYANKINKNGYDEIVKIQEDYKNNAEFQQNLILAIPIILFVSLIIPVGIYFKFGREPKVTYDAPYEHDIPTDNTPMFVDAMFSTKSDVGSLSNNGIQAAIMAMINDKIIKIANKDEKSNNIKLILPENTSNLPQHKQSIVNLLLKPFARDNVLDFNNMKSDLRVDFVAKRFNDNLRNIKKYYESSEVKPVLRQYFNSKGSTYLKYYAIILAIFSIIIVIYSMVIDPMSLFLFLTGIIFIIAAGIVFFLPNRFAGSWTEEGLTRFKKWKAFNKFLNDFSLIKQHPPESIEIWNRYLVYATALGSAKAVSKAMKTIAPATELGYSDVYYYNYYGGPTMFASVIATSSNTVNSDNSGFGGAGGGSGGGGGGAF